MTHIHQEIRVDAPIDHVWEVAIDPDKIPDYNPYMDVRKLSGPLDRVGTTFESTMRVLGQTRTSLVSVLEVQPKELLKLEGHDKEGTSTWTYRFVPEGAKTKCTLDVDYEVQGFVAEIADRVYVERSMERQIRHMAENFAALAEVKAPQLA